MKTVYKFIEFQIGPTTTCGKPNWHIYTTSRGHEEIGFVLWNWRFESWELTTRETASFDKTCLADVIDFIKQLEAFPLN